MSTIKQGDSVILEAAREFCGWNGRFRDRPASGPLTVDRVYQCGEHVRISAHGAGLTSVDAAARCFTLA